MGERSRQNGCSGGPRANSPSRTQTCGPGSLRSAWAWRVARGGCPPPTRGRARARTGRLVAVPRARAQLREVRHADRLEAAPRGWRARLQHLARHVRADRRRAPRRDRDRHTALDPTATTQPRCGPDDPTHRDPQNGLGPPSGWRSDREVHAGRIEQRPSSYSIPAALPGRAEPAHRFCGSRRPRKVPAGEI